MAKKGLITRIALSREMYDYIDELIKKTEVKQKYDYKSVADFVRAAVRDKLNQLEEELRSPLKKLVD